jgi:gamma-glutamylcyclotransferase (GGCT)/AIG2-like uncharacterized protein YtfP
MTVHSETGGREELPLFVYGTLRHGGMNHGKVEQAAASVVPAQLHDYALYMDDGPLVLPRAGSAVIGDVLTFSARSYAQTMAALDAFEGYDPADEAASIHARIRVAVRTAAGDDLTAWCYVRGTRPIAGECKITGFENGLVPDGDWLRMERARRSADPALEQSPQ